MKQMNLNIIKFVAESTNYITVNLYGYFLLTLNL